MVPGSQNPLAQRVPGVPGTLWGAQRVPWDPGTLSDSPLNTIPHCEGEGGNLNMKYPQVWREGLKDPRTESYFSILERVIDYPTVGGGGVAQMFTFLRTESYSSMLENGSMRSERRSCTKQQKQNYLVVQKHFTPFPNPR